MNSFLANFYGTLFAPSATFNESAKNPQVLQGFIAIVFINILKTVTNSNIQGSLREAPLLVLKIFFSVFGALILWFLTAVIIHIAAKFFNRETKILAILTLTGFACIPQIFLAPIELIKNGGAGGYLLGILMGITIQIWTLYLIFLAVIKTYNATPARALAFSMIPFLASILFFNWTTGLFSNLYHIFRL